MSDTTTYRRTPAARAKDTADAAIDSGKLVVVVFNARRIHAALLLTHGAIVVADFLHRVLA